MNSQSNSLGNWAIFFLILGFVSSVMGIIVDVTAVLGLSAQLQTIGQVALFVVLIVTTTIIFFRAYRKLGRECWRNELRLIRAKRRLQKFLDDYDGKTVDAHVDIGEILLIRSCRRARTVHCRVTNVEVFNSDTDPAQRRIELIIDKGQLHLIPTMTLGVYEKHQPTPLCRVQLALPGPVAGESNAGRATLSVKSTRINFPNDPAWNLALDDLTPDAFEVRLIEPQASSILNNLLSMLFFELNRDWNVDDLRIEVNRN